MLMMDMKVNWKSLRKCLFLALCTWCLPNDVSWKDKKGKEKKDDYISNKCVRHIYVIQDSLHRVYNGITNSACSKLTFWFQGYLNASLTHFSLRFYHLSVSVSQNPKSQLWFSIFPYCPPPTYQLYIQKISQIYLLFSLSTNVTVIQATINCVRRGYKIVS